MSRIAKLLLLLALFSCSGLSAISLISPSAFSSPVKQSLQSSLLNIEQAAREDSISIYGKGLYHPFASIPRFGDAFVDAFRWGKARHSILGYQEGNLAAELNVLAGYEHHHADEDYGFLYKGLRLNAEYGKHWQINSLWWNGQFLGEQSAALGSELLDGYSKPSGEHISLDNFSGDLSYGSQNLSLAIGRGKFPLGSSISGSIIMNDRVNDYAYLMAEGRVGKFSLSFLHGSLMADSTYAIYDYGFLNEKSYPDKYVAVHQLGYSPKQELNLFAGEAVIYGNRGMDINYLLPNAFWRASEHNLWDRDNMMLFAGANYKPVAPLFMYAQLALDELSYGRLFSHWWGNKYAAQGGFRYAWSSNPQAHIGLELTAVRPFTYTHYMNHTMFSHDGRSLGYPKGSNIVDIILLLSLPYKDICLWQSGLSYSKQGSYGSDWRINYKDYFPGAISDNATAHWFEGEISKTTTWENSLLLDVFAHHRLLIGQKSSYVNTWQTEYYAAWQLSY